MFLDWLLYPLLLTAASIGHGLLLRRIFGGVPSFVLVAPAGFASMVVLCALVMLTPLYAVAWLAIVVPAVAGWLLAVTQLRTWRPTRDHAIPAAVGVAVFCVYGAPVILSGAATIAGYSLTVDIAHHLDLTSWLMAHGTATPDPTASSQQLVAHKLLGSTYPIGFHATLGAWAQLLGTEPAWLFQPTIAFGAPMAALSAFSLLRQTKLTPAFTALGAFVAAQPALLYGYSLETGFKELWSFCMILLAAAVVAEVVTGSPRRMLLVLVPVLGGLASFWLTIGPWLAVVVGLPALWVAWRGLRALWRRRPLPVPAMAAIGGAGLVVVVLVLVKLAGRVEVPQVVTAQDDLGNLAKPLSGWTVGGVWLTGDYRFPLMDRTTLTYVLVGIVLAAAVVGVILVARLGRWALAPLAVAVGGTLVFLLPQTGPWVDAKILAIDSGIVVLLGMAGAGLLAGWRRLRIAGWVLGAVIAGGVLFSNALAYHNVTLAPKGRYEELARIGDRFAGQGPALAPYFDEYAEYFLRRLNAEGRVNPTSGYFPIGYNEPDIVSDEYKASFVNEFRTLVLRRGPDRIRPPAIFKLAFRGRYYDVWTRQAPKPAVLMHTSFAPGAPRSAKICRDLVTVTRKADPRSKLAWATVPQAVVVQPVLERHNPGWPTGGVATGLATRGPGYIDAGIVIPATGTYQVWVQGSFGRRIKLVLDSHDIGSIKNRADYVAEGTLGATVRITKGRHNFRITRGGGNLQPGNGDESVNRFVGPIFFVGPGKQTSHLVVTSPAAAARVCRSPRPFAWVELLAPGTPVTP